jgi:hypothetical protein
MNGRIEFPAQITPNSVEFRANVLTNTVYLTGELKQRKPVADAYSEDKDKSRQKNQARFPGDQAPHPVLHIAKKRHSQRLHADGTSPNDESIIALSTCFLAHIIVYNGFNRPGK